MNDQTFNEDWAIQRGLDAHAQQHLSAIGREQRPLSRMELRPRKHRCDPAPICQVCGKVAKY